MNINNVVCLPHHKAVATRRWNKELFKSLDEGVWEQWGIKKLNCIYIDWLVGKEGGSVWDLSRE